MPVGDMTVDQLEGLIRKVVKETLEGNHDGEFTDEFIGETLDAMKGGRFHSIEGVKRDFQKGGKNKRGQNKRKIKGV